MHAEQWFDLTRKACLRGRARGSGMKSERGGLIPWKSTVVKAVGERVFERKGGFDKPVVEFDMVIPIELEAVEAADEDEDVGLILAASA